MALAPDWFRQLKQAWMIPEIIAERCVHSHCEVASCARCVDACPREAWLLDDDSLQIDTTRCDGCGLCVTACTESALGQNLLPALRTVNSEGTLLFACEQAGEEGDGEGVIPCLHSVSSTLLLEYYCKGYRQVLSCRGNCETCPRYGGRDLFREQLARLNTLLASRSAPRIRHAQITRAVWDERRNSSPSIPLLAANMPEPQYSRRQFLRQAITFTVEKGMEQAGVTASENSVPLPWPVRLPAHTADNHCVLYPFVPELNASRCNGCDACLQLCPHQALQLDKPASGSAKAYQIRADYCTGCNICMDTCDQQAIRIQKMRRQKQTSIPLMEAVCKACGSRFHYPIREDNALLAYCRICAGTNHHQKLFQVY